MTENMDESRRSLRLQGIEPEFRLIPGENEVLTSNEIVITLKIMTMFQVVV